MVGTSSKDRVVGPLPYMAMKMAEINGSDPITTETGMMIYLVDRHSVCDLFIPKRWVGHLTHL